MSKVHLVRSSAFSRHDFTQCIDMLEHDDYLILLDDGCYNVNHPAFMDAVDQIGSEKIYVIEHHFKARAITTTKKLHFTSINFVIELVSQGSNTITWQ